MVERDEEKGAAARRRWRGRARTAGWLLLWTLLVCYPNPLVFFRNFLRYARFPIDPAVIDHIRFPVPEQPQQIEEAVLTGVAYEFDWRQYGVPWYVPTPVEVARSGRGDCESRAVVLASLLQARGIAYRLEASPVHIWVDYLGKKPNTYENSQLAIMRRENGRYRFRLPSLLRLREDARMQKEALWDVMPAPRKIALLGGWTVLLALPWLRRRAEKSGERESSLTVAPSVATADIMHDA